MHTIDPHLAHIVATAKEQLQDNLIHLENALKDAGDKRTTSIFGMVFFIVGTSLHFHEDTDPDVEINAVKLLNSAGFDSVWRNNMSLSIMDWFSNPTYQD